MGKTTRRVDSKRRIILPKNFEGVEEVYTYSEGPVVLVSREEGELAERLRRTLTDFRRERLRRWGEEFRALGALTPEDVRRLLEAARKKKVREVLEAVEGRR